MCPQIKAKICTKNGCHGIHVRFYASLPLMAMWSCTAKPPGGINSWWGGCWKGQRHVCEQHKGPFSAHRSRTMRPDLGGDASRQTNRVSAVALDLGGSSSPLLLRQHVLIQPCAAKTTSSETKFGLQKTKKLYQELAYNFFSPQCYCDAA